MVVCRRTPRYYRVSKYFSDLYFGSYLLRIITLPLFYFYLLHLLYFKLVFIMYVSSLYHVPTPERALLTESYLSKICLSMMYCLTHSTMTCTSTQPQTSVAQFFPELIFLALNLMTMSKVFLGVSDCLFSTWVYFSSEAESQVKSCWSNVTCLVNSSCS